MVVVMVVACCECLFIVCVYVCVHCVHKVYIKCVYSINIQCLHPHTYAQQSPPPPCPPPPPAAHPPAAPPATHHPPCTHPRPTQPRKNSTQQHTYVIDVATAHREGAGGDMHVSIVLHGSMGDTGSLVLHEHIRHVCSFTCV